MDEKTVLQELINMSQTLGKPENDYVILGEGNTSGKVDDDFFYVKASGKYLSQSDEKTFVKVKMQDALGVLDKGELTDDQIKLELNAAKADQSNPLMPSIETTFHGFLLSLPGINFVGHTHATAVNALLCSKNAKEIINGGRLFPDEIVYCGIEPIFMEYQDPGLGLARGIRDETNAFIKRNGCVPKVILIRNHGIIAVGKNAHEVEAITAMYCKAARVLLGATGFGGVNYLSEENVRRIYTRPDEELRIKQSGK
jgi:rhamnose utilization protein RhaD (predicted bifunctional aldolase and dehydrogenase)